jgi:hypothetical protein
MGKRLRSISKFGRQLEQENALAKAETFSKPGTADVTPSDAAKIAPLARHYLAKPHPFTSCVRDQKKHGLSDDHAKRRCAVLLDKFDPGRKRHSVQKGADPAEVQQELAALGEGTIRDQMVGELEVRKEIQDVESHIRRGRDGKPVEVRSYKRSVLRAVLAELRSGGTAKLPDGRSVTVKDGRVTVKDNTGRSSFVGDATSPDSVALNIESRAAGRVTSFHDNKRGRVYDNLRRQPTQNPQRRDEQTTAQEMAARMAANRRAGRPLFAPLGPVGGSPNKDKVMAAKPGTLLVTEDDPDNDEFVEVVQSGYGRTDGKVLVQYESGETLPVDPQGMRLAPGEDDYSWESGGDEDIQYDPDTGEDLKPGQSVPSRYGYGDDRSDEYTLAVDDPPDKLINDVKRLPRGERLVVNDEEFINSYSVAHMDDGTWEVTNFQATEGGLTGEEAVMGIREWLLGRDLDLTVERIDADAV